MSAREEMVTRIRRRLDDPGAAALVRGEVVARPDRTAAVQELLRWAGERGVTVRSAPARPVGHDGALAGPGEVRLTLRRLQGALRLDRTARTVAVPGGTTGVELAWRLHREGFWPGPRPWPFFARAIGETLAGPALAGEHTAMGIWESPLMAVEAVLGDGRLLRAGVAPRSAAGPDYRAFLLGTGDRVGVITEVTWRVVARSIPMLTAAVVPSLDAALRLLADHCGDGWRPLASAVIEGRDPAAWSGDRGGGSAPRRPAGATVLLCHRAQGTRAELLRRQLGDGVAAAGGEVLAPAAARSWFEGTFHDLCRHGVEALEASAPPRPRRRLGTAWIAAPWPAMAGLWKALRAGRRGRWVGRVSGEGFRPEGGLLRVIMVGRDLAGAAEDVLARLDEAGGRLTTLLDADDRPVAPVCARHDAGALLDQVAAELGGPLNPPRHRGEG